MDGFPLRQQVERILHEYPQRTLSVILQVASPASQTRLPWRQEATQIRAVTNPRHPSRVVRGADAAALLVGQQPQFTLE